MSRRESQARITALHGAEAILLTCLATKDDALESREFTREDVQRLHVLAARHGVSPIVYERLCAPFHSSKSLLDADDEQHFRLAYHASRLRARATRAEIAEVLSALNDAHVPAIPLKGAYLAEHVYRDPALRPMLDLDLLIPPERIHDAAESLLAIGYEWDQSSLAKGPRAVDYASHHHLRRLVRVGRLPVELHHALTRADAPQHIDTSELWRLARSTRVAGIDTLALAPEHLLLHLIVHAASHGFVIPLLALEDIALVAGRVAPADDWPRFASAARAARASGLAYATLALARDLIAARIPPDALASLEHTPDDETIVPSLARTILDQFTELPASYERALNEAGVWRRAATLLRGLVPSPRRLRAERDLSSGALVSYYLRRPVDVVRRHSRNWRLLFTPDRFESGRVATQRWLAGAP